MADRMVEKVARAMFKQDHDEPWGQGEPRTKLIYLNNARAALEASHHEELVKVLKQIAELQDDKCQTASAEMLYALLSIKVGKARAVLKEVEGNGHA